VAGVFVHETFQKTIGSAQARLEDYTSIHDQRRDADGPEKTLELEKEKNSVDISHFLHTIQIEKSGAPSDDAPHGYCNKETPYDVSALTEHVVS
jgi:hypothetical protein